MKYMNRQTILKPIKLLLATLLFASCAAPKYLPAPTLEYPTIVNTYTFGIQNMDGQAQIESNTLTCHYEGFDVVYRMVDNMVATLTIINNSNKSLIIDKSKCFVLYNGYSTQLFKDVRSTRNTTFNNVQDAINNVQTTDASVSMTIPPYSKWNLPIQETNIRAISKLPAFKNEVGLHALSPYDNDEPVEFVIPYTFDYSMAKWDTSRNRLYVNSMEVANGTSTKKGKKSQWLSVNQYMIARVNGDPDYTEANRIDALNRKIYKKHKTQVIIADILCLPLTFCGNIWWIIAGGCFNDAHQPPTYGNKK